MLRFAGASRPSSRNVRFHADSVGSTPESRSGGEDQSSSAVDPGCVKTASKCSKRDFLWIQRFLTSIKSICYETATPNNWPTLPPIVVFAGVFTQPGSTADQDGPSAPRRLSVVEPTESARKRTSASLALDPRPTLFMSPRPRERFFPEIYVADNRASELTQTFSRQDCPEAERIELQDRRVSLVVSRSVE